MGRTQLLVPNSILLIGILCAHSAYASDRPHYQYWYSDFKNTFVTILRDNCSSELQQYQKGYPDDFDSHCGSDLTEVQCASTQVIKCLLENTPEDIKSNAASAAVLLGLLPTMLALASSSTAEIGLLALRRPFLAVFLAAGGPAVSPIRTFEYREPIELLANGPNAFTAIVNLRSPYSTITLFVQYILAFAATANLLHVSWELGIYSVVGYSSDTWFQPIVWALLSLVVHFLGAVAVYLRARQEFELSAHKPAAVLCVRKERLSFYLFSWLTSTTTIVHIIYGTLVLSGTLFVSTANAIRIVVRYFGSTIVCRLILMMEISGMRETTEVFKEPHPL
ncbi:hypothetical protein F4859DRAFT_506830 [Xylaria cf. heliscus]|nr:hypothetical protein F4859DRAFT_506830 [Xylaria cf. heliscus]